MPEWAFKVQTAGQLQPLLYRDQKLTLIISFKKLKPDMSRINKSEIDEVINLDTTQDSNRVSDSLVISSENISIECNRNGVQPKLYIPSTLTPYLSALVFFQFSSLKYRV